MPAKTPVAVIRRLNQEIAKFIHIPDERKTPRFRHGSCRGHPEEMAVQMKAEIVALGKVIKDADVKVD